MLGIMAYTYNSIYLGVLQFKDSPGKNVTETPIFTNSWTYWGMPVIPATQEV
jgi:hypothetical protein